MSSLLLPSGLPGGVKLSSRPKRLVALLLDKLLLVATLGVGWFLWSFLVWRRGQSPAKQLLRMKVITSDGRSSAGWGTMFLRELVAKTLVAFSPFIVVYWLFAVPPGGTYAVYLELLAPLVLIAGLVVPFAWLLWDRNKQQLWDKLVSTVVVDDPHRRIGPRGEMNTRVIAEPPPPVANLDAVMLYRAQEYFLDGNQDIGRKLLREAVGVARRRGDRASLELAVTLASQWNAVDIALDASDALRPFSAQRTPVGGAPRRSAPRRPSLGGRVLLPAILALAGALLLTVYGVHVWRGSHEKLSAQRTSKLLSQGVPKGVHCRRGAKGWTYVCFYRDRRVRSRWGSERVKIGVVVDRKSVKMLSGAMPAGKPLPPAPQS